MMSFKDLKAKRDSRRVTTVTASLAPPSEETQHQDQDPQRVSSPLPKGYDDLQAAWTLYKAVPPNTKIQETVERGRGLWATTPISPGDVRRIESPVLYLTIKLGITGARIISTKPHVYALSIRYLSSYCSNCISEATTRCSKCQTVHYCSAK